MKAVWVNGAAGSVWEQRGAPSTGLRTSPGLSCLAVCLISSDLSGAQPLPPTCPEGLRCCSQSLLAVGDLESEPHLRLLLSDESIEASGRKSLAWEWEALAGFGIA